MSDFTVQPLLNTGMVALRDVCCRAGHRHKSAEECTTATYMVFPYRGVFVRHVGHHQVVADSSQALFFNAAEGYRVSHPVGDGDACLDLVVDQAVLHELVPRELLRDGGGIVVFGKQRLPIDPKAQALVALLRHGLQQGIAESLEAESLALTLVRRTLSPRTTYAASRHKGSRRLVDRVKLLLAGDLSRRWTLADIAAEIGGSPVYLTQVFRQVEGVPLYRYQLRLRLARALYLLEQYDDLTALSLELGFSSHSHFSSAFQRTYGRSPSEFRRSALDR